MNLERAQLVPEGTRHREVLDAALELIAERGYAGASLRRLAARLGMQQPSLYHYFSSKKELVHQIIATYSGDMFAVGLRDLPTRLEDIPAFVRDRVFEIYRRPSHPLFVRVAVAVARVDAEAGLLMRELFTERTIELMRPFVRQLIQGTDVKEIAVIHTIQMVTNAIGFRLMEEKVLFDERPLGPAVDAFGDFVVESGRLMLNSLLAESRG